MKLTPNLLFISILLTTGCQRDVISPEDVLLYRRWQWIESRPLNQPVYKPDPTRTVVTFKPSGEYVYEFNGKQFTCCQPNRFVRQGRQLTFSYVAGGYSSPECITISCAPYQPIQQIDSLSAERLVISMAGRGQSVYQAVP